MKKSLIALMMVLMAVGVFAEVVKVDDIKSNLKEASVYGFGCLSNIDTPQSFLNMYVRHGRDDWQTQGSLAIQCDKTRTSISWNAQSPTNMVFDLGYLTSFNVVAKKDKVEMPMHVVIYKYINYVAVYGNGFYVGTHLN